MRDWTSDPRRDPRTKPELVTSIASRLSAPAPPVAHGSREPKRILELINERLALGFDERLPKPDLARQIVQAAGLSWAPYCWSRPQTLTRAGLVMLDRAVEKMLRPLERP